jgi:hypothetical protein
MQFVEGRIDELLLKRLEVSVNKVRMPSVWQDEDRITSDKYEFEEYHSDDELADSENTTTEMEFEEDSHHIQD